LLKDIRNTLICFCLSGFFFPAQSSGQIDDIGLWLGATVQKQITRELEGSLMEEVRFDHDVTTVDAVISDAGLAYSFSKKLKAEFHYRFINSNQENYYSKRHRLYFDVSWKEKIGIATLTLRERLQEQYNDIYSSENGKIPVWTIRSKLAAKFDLNKKYTPYISGEVYYLLDNAKEIDHFVTRLRFETGISYEINRIHSINPYILYQTAQDEIFRQLIYGVSYTFSL
jgi:hypothetical protein